MKVAFSTGRPAHVVLPANLLAARGVDVLIYTAAYRSRFRGLAPEVRLRWVPQLVPSLHFLTGHQLSRPWQRGDTAMYDHLVGLQMEECNLFWGWATGALASGRAARRRGARFVLDRACPHVDLQQTVIRQESERLGVPYEPEPDWFRQRQLAEYSEADVILVPSRYSQASFPAELQEKVLVAPLFGRVPPIVAAGKSSLTSGYPFTFGTIGIQPLRKGFLYVLEAWEQLRLPNARLLLRTDAPLDQFPALQAMLARLPNVEIVGYVEQMSDFYRSCDAFCFPTVDDGFGMVLLEAMAHGLPSITTDRCGAAELFTPGEDFLQVPAQNSEALAQAMEQLVRSSALRDYLAHNARGKLDRIASHGEYSLYAETLTRITELAL